MPGTPHPGQEAAHPVAPPPVIEEPWRTGGPSGGRRRSVKKPLLIGAAGLAVVALAAAGALVVPGLLGDDDGDGEAGAKLAGSLFPVDGAARTDGRDQQVTGVAALGSTVVAVGGETDPQDSRGLFLVSTDGGRTFESVAQQDTDGGVAPPGGVPAAVGASSRGWVAIGHRAGGAGAVWTSEDGKEWRRQPDAVGDVFGANDRVTRIVGTGSGFLAIGQNSPKGDFSDARPAAWLSADGRRWEERVDDQIGLQVQKGDLALVEAAAAGDVILLEGLITPDSRKPGPYRKVWRSEDGGRTWATSEVPVPKGSRGLMIGGGEGGFLAMREMKASGKLFGQAYASKDGRSWTKAGKLEPSGYGRTSGIASDGQGFTAVVVRGGDVLLSRSADGTAWKDAGTAESKAGREVLGAAAAGGQTVLVGREPGGGDTDPMLGVWDASGTAVPVDLTKIPGAIRPDHAVRAVSATGSLAVAVGSASGDAAAWSSADGASWKPAQGLGAAFTRPGPQQLNDVVAGGAGWLAVGYDQAPARRPLVVTSKDGATWQAADTAPAFGAGRGGAPVTYAAAAGSAGYVVVGTEGYSAAAWSSTDLKSWSKGARRRREGDDGQQERDPLDAGRHGRSVRVRRRRRKPGRQGQPPLGVGVARRQAVDAAGSGAAGVRRDRGASDPCRGQGQHARGGGHRGHAERPRLARLRLHGRGQDVAPPGVSERRDPGDHHRADRDPEGLRRHRHHRSRRRDRRRVLDVRRRRLLAGGRARRHRPRRRRRPADHRAVGLRGLAARGGPQRRLPRRSARPVEPPGAVTASRPGGPRHWSRCGGAASTPGSPSAAGRACRGV
ncbi:hypothetical protein LUX57_22600 [Actinomadura madurae]|uniref:hypothetical protein n=1 Tax=Actinomadura madurae TaxID=1993 RepID=UPI0020D205A9|nr:hypothetical protein [Actinomadura madurae]MCP9967574.1 hypothetical protein [Actinomadura madurae]